MAFIFVSTELMGQTGWWPEVAIGKSIMEIL